MLTQSDLGKISNKFPKHLISETFLPPSWSLLNAGSLVEIFWDKLTKFHRLNVSHDSLWSSPEEPHYQGEVEVLEVEPEIEEQSPSQEPNIRFVQKILKETREMMRNRTSTTNNDNGSNATNNTSLQNRQKGRGKPKKD